MRNTGNAVVACIDGSSYSSAVCDYAAWMADRIGAPLKLLHNIEHPPSAVMADLSGSIGLGSREELLTELTEIEQQRNRLMLEKGKLMLEGARDRIRAAGGPDPEIWQRHGNLNESLVEMEEKLRVLVLGLRGERHEGDETGVGAHLETVVRALHKPILVVNKEFAPPRRVMLAYNGSDACQKALSMIAATDLFKNIPCHLVHVGKRSAQAETMLKDATNILTEAGQETHSAILDGKLEEALTQYQADNGIDMTIMGAFSHNRVRDFLLGSFTARMLADTRQPLLLLR